MHHHKFDDLRRCIDSLLRDVNFGVLTLLCNKRQLIKRLLCDTFKEFFHTVMVFADVSEELLSMRARLSAGTCSNVLLHFFPIFPV